MSSPQLNALYPVVRRVPVDKSEGEFPTLVEVTLKDGAVCSAEVEMPVGSLAAPLSEAQYSNKFGECAEPYISPLGLAELKGELEQLADLESIAPVMNRLAQPWALHG